MDKNVFAISIAVLLLCVIYGAFYYRIPHKRNKYWKVVGVITILVTIVDIPFIISERYKANTGYITPWGASDVLSFYGSLLAFIGTVSLGVLALYQNKRIEKINERSNEINSISKIIEFEQKNLLTLEKSYEDYINTADPRMLMAKFYEYPVNSGEEQKAYDAFKSVILINRNYNCKMGIALFKSIFDGFNSDKKANLQNQITKYFSSFDDLLEKILKEIDEGNGFKNIMNDLNLVSDLFLKLNEEISNYMIEYKQNLGKALYNQIDLQTVSFLFGRIPKTKEEK